MNPPIVKNNTLYNNRMNTSFRFQLSKFHFGVYLILIYLLSCANAGTKDPKEQLADLQKQEIEINSKIQKLELSQGDATKTDSSLINYKQVEIKALQLEHFVHTIAVQGKVESDQTLDVNPKTGGAITKIYVTEGQSVKEGQILANIDNQIQKGNLAQLESQYSLAKILFEKQKNLWDQQIGTEVQYLQAKTNKESLEKNMAIVKDQIGQTNILSPISGTVDAIMARLGETASPGQATFRIVNTNVLKIQGGLGENYINQVNIGYPLTLEFPDLAKVIQTKVGFISRSIDPVTRTFTIQTKLTGQSSIRPNMIANMKIQDYENPKAMVVPVNIIQNDQEGSFVYIALKGTNPKFGTAKKKMVKTGLVQDDKIEIKSGLDLNDLVIVRGFQGLNDGTSLSF